MTESLLVAAGISALAWYASALYVGGRLLRLGVRRDRPPARWLGTYLFFAMGLGSILISVPMARGEVAGAAMTALDRALVGLGCTVTAVGNVAILTFTCRVFRRESTIAKAAALAVTALLVGGAIGHGLTTGFDARLVSGYAALYLVGTVLANGWTSVESLHYYGLMRKRLALGLAEPLEANRFLLWGCGAGAAAILLLMTTIELQVRAALGATGLEALRLVSLLAMSVLGLACAACYLFAFFPAAWYVARLAPAQRQG